MVVAAEELGEVARALDADGAADLGYGQVGAREQVGGLCEPVHEQVAGGAHAEGFCETAQALALAHVGRGGDLAHGELVGVVVDDVVAHEARALGAHGVLGRDGLGRPGELPRGEKRLGKMGADLDLEAGLLGLEGVDRLREMPGEPFLAGVAWTEDEQVDAGGDLERLDVAAGDRRARAPADQLCVEGGGADTRARFPGGGVRAPCVNERGRARRERGGPVRHEELEGPFDAEDGLEALVPVPGKVVAGLVAVELVEAAAAEVLVPGRVEFLPGLVETEHAAWSMKHYWLIPYSIWRISSK